MRNSDKGWLARKLERWELSDTLGNSTLLRLLIGEVWFRVAFVVLVLGLVFLGLFLPKIWLSTPRGFTPEIRISGLDVAQAWSLKRNALKAMAEGRNEDAMFAWRAALANTPANLELSRGLLEFILKTEQSKTFLGHAVGRSAWLLKLGGENPADVELVSRIYAKYQLYDMLLALLEPRRNSLSPEMEADCLKALFNVGRVDEFAARLAKTDRQKLKDPELPLYEAAYRAAWGPPETGEQGRKILDEAQEDPARRVLASRLQLAASRRRNDIVTFERTLQRLSEWREDSAIDHVGYWRFLADNGQKSRAVELARNYTFPPQTAAETIRLAEGYVELDLRDSARQMLKRFAPQFGYAEGVWLIYARLLTRDQLWDDLRELSIVIRQQNQISDNLSAQAYFLEGRAETGLNRRSAAEKAFARLVEYPFTNGFLVLRLSESVLQLGYPEPVRDLLLRHQEELRKSPKYWHLMLACAYELKLPEQMLEASTRSYELAPDHPTVINDHAAMLLALRRKPEEAIRLTMQYLSRNPNSVGARLNHSLALLQNHRASEAKELLETIPPESRLTPEEANTYHLAWFEARAMLRQWDQAWREAAKLDPKLLLPGQIQWLEETQRRFPADDKPAA